MSSDRTRVLQRIGRIGGAVRALKTCIALSWLAASTASAATSYYDAAFRADIRAQRPTISVELELRGERLPSRIEFHIDPTRHRSFASTDPVTTKGTVVTWLPSGSKAQLTYEFVATHERSAKRFDSLVTSDWAVFRGDKLVPRVAVTAPRNARSRTTLEFTLPAQWSVAAAYPQEGPLFKVADSVRKFDRPSGWILAGKLGKRSELIDGVQTIVAAPEGESSRRQDILAFLNWNLPHLKDVFTEFPKRLLVVSAGDPMFRGGLSGPASLFIHSDRPLISENRTSTLLHELVHVAMGIRGDEESDWIVEGFAEYYSLEILRRSGGIGRSRYEEALKRMEGWARRTPNVFKPESSGASTARAVIALRAADLEIRKHSGGRANLDDVAAALAERGGEVSLEILQNFANRAAGQEVLALQRQRLNAPLQSAQLLTAP